MGGKKRLPSPYANFRGGTKLPNPETNVNKDVAKRWKKPGDEKVTDIPALIKGLNYSFTVSLKIILLLGNNLIIWL